MLRNNLKVQDRAVIQWNTKFESSLAQAARDGSLTDLLLLLSRIFPCDRIYIFQKNQFGNYDCSEEWCAPDVSHKRDFMQNLSGELCHLYYRHYHDHAFLQFADISTLKETDPDLYTLLKPQGIRSLVSAQLTFAGEDLGFFGIDNPEPSKIPDIVSCLGILRIFIASILYSRLGGVEKAQLQAKDLLTGAGSWHGLYAAIERMDPTASIGIICCNLIGLGKINLTRGRQIGDSVLVETSRIIRGVFGSEHTYRIDGDDFIVVINDISSTYFEEMSDHLKQSLLDSGIAVQYSEIWDPSWIGTADSMLDRARANLYPLTKYEDVLPADSDNEPASIALPRDDSFRARADVWLRMLSPGDSRIAVVAIDFNHFTLFGHIAGRDAANKKLEGMSRRLSEYATSFRGTAGYLGGDNFALLLPVNDLTHEQVRDELRLIAGKDASPVGFAPAFGVYVTGYSTQSFTQLYDHAAAALEEVRGKYDRTVAFFDAEAYEHQRQVTSLLSDIPGALRRGEFIFYVQPRVHLKTGKITSAEALIRWKKDGQILPPSAFLERLEENGYVVALDYYIWEQVIAWQHSLVQKGLNPLPVSVNVSQVDFYFMDVAESFRTLLDDYELDPSLIEIEITESACIEERSLISDFITKAHAIGLHILMDDFGSASSSVDTLRNIHADTLIIARQYMQQFHDKDMASLMSSIINIAHMLHKHVIAEGIENASQVEALKLMNCSHAQGFYFYRPMKPEAYEKLLTGDARK